MDTKRITLYSALCLVLYGALEQFGKDLYGWAKHLLTAPLSRVVMALLPLLLAAAVTFAVWLVIDYSQLRRWVKGYHFSEFQRWLNRTGNSEFKDRAETHADGMVASYDAWLLYQKEHPGE